jgi:hypothetical protein
MLEWDPDHEPLRTMKRFLGLVLALLGGGVALWGGYHCLTGDSDLTVAITPDLAVTAMTASLIGIAVFTVGLIWARD